jgi:DNA-binding IclR family transcriptional regulator/nitroimidazol reductase NimA-like FMN-containing flavoprotein (pyridoxamine 5'-phosphate oxidase superfamily)
LPTGSITPTVERTLKLIELLLAQPDGLTPQEMLPQLDVSRSTLFLMLRTFKTLGYVEQAEKRGRYSPGPRLQAWRTSRSLSSQDLLTAFYQETSHRSMPETLALLVSSPEGPLVLAQVEPDRQIRSVLATGQAQFLMQAAVEILQADPPQEVKEHGYALGHSQESLELALPICRDGIHPDAVLVLSAPAYRWEVNAYTDAFLGDLRAMAARLSYQLGATLYAPFSSGSQTSAQPARLLSPDEIDRFLQGPWTARLACVRPDGLPHVIPVWQEWNGKAFSIIAWQGSQWAEYIRQNPQVSLTVDEPWTPLRRVVARGKAEIIDAENSSIVEALVSKMTMRYLGYSAPELVSQVSSVYRIALEYLRGWQGTPWKGTERSPGKDESQHAR